MPSRVAATPLPAILLLASLLIPATAQAQTPTVDDEAADQVVPPTVTSIVRNQRGFGFPGWGHRKDVPARPAGRP